MMHNRTKIRFKIFTEKYPNINLYFCIDWVTAPRINEDEDDSWGATPMPQVYLHQKEFAYLAELIPKNFSLSRPTLYQLSYQISQMTTRKI